MKFFSLLTEREVRDKNWQPIKFGRSAPAITHSLFVDDMVLFDMDDGYTISTVRKVLDIFCAASAQFVSHTKLDSAPQRICIPLG